VAFFGVGGAAVAVDPLELLAQVPFLHQADAGRGLVHPQRERRQHLERLHHVQVAGGAAGQAAHQVPAPQQGLHVGLVELRPPFRQGDALAFHDGEDGEEQRVGGERSHARVAAHRIQQLGAFAGRLPAGEERVAAGRFFNRRRPLVHERFDFFLLEIHQGAFGEVLGLGPDVAVAHDAAGENEFVPCGVMVAVAVADDPLDHGIAQAGVAHLVQTVEEEEDAALREAFVQQILQRVHAPLRVIAGDEAIETDVLFSQSVGIGGEWDEHRQADLETEPLPLAGGEGQSEELQKGRLAGSWIAEDDEAVVPAQEIQNRLRLADAVADRLRFFLGRPASGEAQPLPGLSLRRLYPRFQGDVHLEQRHLEGHSVGDAEPLEVEILVALNEALEIGGGGAGQVRGRMGGAQALPERFGVCRSGVGVDDDGADLGSGFKSHLEARPSGLHELCDLDGEVRVRGEDLTELMAERGAGIGIFRLARDILRGFGGGRPSLHLAAELRPEPGAGLLARLLDSFLRRLATGGAEERESLRQQDRQGIEEDRVHERLSIGQTVRRFSLGALASRRLLFFAPLTAVRAKTTPRGS